MGCVNSTFKLKNEKNRIVKQINTKCGAVERNGKNYRKGYLEHFHTH